MTTRAAIALIVLVLGGQTQNQSCGLTKLTGPDAIQSKTEDAMRPYFPRVKAQALPQSGIILAVTCTSLGVSAIQQIPAALAQNQGIHLLSQLHRFGVLPYRFVALGFEDSILRYDLETNQYVVLSGGSLPNYSAGFEQACRAPEVVPANAEYVYIGVWTLTIGDSTGQTHSWVDSLGVYRDPDEFALQRDNEIAAREAFIRKVYSDKGTPSRPCC